MVFSVDGISKLKISVSDDVVVGMNPDGTPQYRSVSILFNGIDASNPYVRITETDLLTANPNFNPSLITSIAFIVDESVEQPSGTVNIGSFGLFFSPELPASTTGPVTDLGPFGVAPGELDPDGIINNFAQQDSTSFSFQYSIDTNEQFGGAILTFVDQNNRPDLSGGDELVFRVFLNRQGRVREHPLIPVRFHHQATIRSMLK